MEKRGKLLLGMVALLLVVPLQLLHKREATREADAIGDELCTCWFQCFCYGDSRSSWGSLKGFGRKRVEGESSRRFEKARGGVVKTVTGGSRVVADGEWRRRS